MNAGNQNSTASNNTGGTIHALLNKLSPKMLVLILSIIVVSIVIVILIATSGGAVVDFKNLKIIPGNSITAEAFIRSLPDDVQGSAEESKKRIAELIEQNKKISTDLQTAINDKKNLEKVLGENRDKFLDRIIRLDKQLTRFNGFINTDIDVKNKVEVFELIQQLLLRIGYYTGEVDGDPIRSVDALKKYKEDKGLERDYWAHVTRNTVIHLVRDYSDTLLAEAKG